MHKEITVLFICLCFSQFGTPYESLPEYHLPFLYVLQAQELQFLVPPEFLDLPVVKAIGVIHTAAALTAEMINNRTCSNFPDILPNTEFILDTYSTYLLNSILIPQMMNFADQNVTFTTGFVSSEEAIAASVVGDVFDIATLSFFAPESSLSDENTYPHFSRTAINNRDQVKTLHEALSYYNEQNGGRGWDKVAIFSEVSSFTAEFASDFIEGGLDYDIKVVEYQSTVSLFNVTPDYTVELTEIKNSGARVILCLFIGFYLEALEQADAMGLIGDDYVWMISQATTEFTFNSSAPLARGTMVAQPFVPDESPYRACFEEAWLGADPNKFIYAGRGELPSVTTFDVFDMVLVSAIAVDILDRAELLDGRYIPPEVWSKAVRSVEIDGLEGFLSFKSNGDRVGTLYLSYYDPDSNTYVPTATFSDVDGYVPFNDFVWYSNTTVIPDLDIREPFDYWSCHDKEKKHDATGKAVELHTPDGSDVDEIASSYHCDAFIDCENLSDESVDCDTNYLILFIIFGILIGILILVAFVLMIFVFIFGIILKYRRLKAVSPLFLIIMLISFVIGFSSLYAFFGKPHPVACAFQPWLLGLPSISMIAALTVKNYRIWRIFLSPLKRTRISDTHLFILWSALMIPAVFIVVLWTIVSTPTAKMEERSEKDHYVCATGGFTGAPGGIVFFSIFVAYAAIVLVTGAVISFLSRNVPSGYNESKLLTISIYNLGFLSIVIIPVFLVVNPFNPFLAWILRTIAIMYAFAATMVLQFVPVTFNIIFIDKGKNISKTQITTGSGSNSRSLSITELSLSQQQQ